MMSSIERQLRLNRQNDKIVNDMIVVVRTPIQCNTNVVDCSSPEEEIHFIVSLQRN